METNYIILLVSLISSSFFSGMEIAFVSNNKYKVGLLKNEDYRTSKIISYFYNNQNGFLSTILIGNNIALVVFGITIALMVEQWFPSIQSEFSLLLIQTAISTLIVLFLGEFIPKVLFQINQNGILKFFALPFLLIFYVLYFFVIGVNAISEYLMKKVFKTNVELEETEYSAVDLGEFVRASTEGASDEDDINTEMFDNALALDNTKVRECMIPRTEITAIENTATLQELKELIKDSRHSRIPVFEENIDKILGYVHHQDLLKKPESFQAVINKIKVVPETMMADDLLDEFIIERQSMAWVVDEFGGTAGVITLEDILEEIFGEIDDEFDEPEFIEQQIASNEWIFSGRLEIDYLNEKYELNIPDGEYETLAGFLFANFESIPKALQIITINQFEFKVLSVSSNKIDTLNLTLLEIEES